MAKKIQARETSRGRPPRHKGERLAKNRTFRVRAGLDEKLVQSSSASGRSVSEEIEFRLESTFAADSMIGGRYAELLRMFYVASILIPPKAQQGNYYDDTVLAWAIARITEEYLAAKMPPSYRMKLPPHALAKTQATNEESDGERIAQLVLSSAGVGNPSLTSPEDQT